MARMPSQRYHELDALRAFAMLLGIFWHTGLNAWFSGNGAGNLGLESFMHVSHAFRLPVFFVMAGFFAALVLAKSGAAAFSRARLKRIGVPFAVGLIILVPLTNLVSARAGDLAAGLPTSPVTFDALMVDKPLHLWFLLYLLIYYAAVLLCRTVATRVPRAERVVRTGFARLAASRFRLVALVPVTTALVWSPTAWVDSPSASFVPPLETLAYYGLFFATGYILYAQRELLPLLRRDYRGYTAVALLAAVLAVAGTQAVEVGTRRYALLVGVPTAVLTWAALFALLGWFHRWFARPSARVRWVADSAYWLYLAHFPLVAAGFLVGMRLGLPLGVNVLVTPSVTIALLLVTYRYGVRYTAVGRLLHGPRERPAPRAARGFARHVPETS